MLFDFLQRRNSPGPFFYWDSAIVFKLIDFISVVQTLGKWLCGCRQSKWPHTAWSLDSNHYPPICDAGCVSLNTKTQFADPGLKDFFSSNPRRPTPICCQEPRISAVFMSGDDVVFFSISFLFRHNIFGRIQARKSAWHNDGGKTDRGSFVMEITLPLETFEIPLLRKGS